MKIGIDARLYYETGVGRYIRNLITQLQKIDRENSYVVFLGENAYSKFEVKENWEKRKVTIPWHSVAEQTAFIPILLKENLDLVHFPYFSYPVLYPGKYIVTIHDMIVSHFATGRATTFSPLIYQMKRLGYQINHRIGLRRTSHIIAVSQATKQEIIKTIGIKPEKISVIYEGVDANLINQKYATHSLIDVPYILYIGNAYPHKNLETLLKAFETVAQNNKTIQLVLVGPDDVFYQRLEQDMQDLPINNRVQFLHAISDSQLVTLYQHAQALVSPSLMEGFGLPIIEALSFNIPVIASDIPVYRELFNDLVNFFNPNSVDDLVSKLLPATEKKLTIPTKKEIDTLLHKFSWEKAARETLRVYE